VVHHYVYIIYSHSTDRYYIGSTADVQQRLFRHNAGATPSTRKGRPWRIMFTKEFDSKTNALKFENFLKRMKSRIMIEALIQNSSSSL